MVKNTIKKKETKKDDAKKIFDTITVIDEKEFKRFQNFYLNKFKFKSNIIPILIMVVLAVVAMCLNVMKENYHVVWLLVAFIIIYPVALNITLNIQIKKMYKSYKRINILEETLTFYDKYLESRSVNNYCKIEYKDLFKVCETKDNFYIFVNENQSFIVIKNCLEDIDKFRDFIKKKIVYRKYR